MGFKEQWEKNLLEQAWLCLTCFVGQNNWSLNSWSSVCCYFFCPKHTPPQGLNVCPSIVPGFFTLLKEGKYNFLASCCGDWRLPGRFLLPFASLPCVFPLGAICSSAVLLEALPGELRLHLPFRASTHLEIIMGTLLLCTAPSIIQAVPGRNQDSALWLHLILSCGEQRWIFIDLDNQVLLSSYQRNSNIWLFCQFWLFQDNSGLPWAPLNLGY